MLNDLRYAMRQLDLAKRHCEGGDFAWRTTVRDSIHRAADALERCIEAAPAMEAAFDRQQIEAETYARNHNYASTGMD